MSGRPHVPRAQSTGNTTVDGTPALSAVADVHRGPLLRLSQRSAWLLLGIVLVSASTLVILSHEHLPGSERRQVRQVTSLAELTATGLFREYAYPRPDSEVMRPAIDHHGRIWFGAMGQNALVAFDPHTRTFQYLTPPHGHHGIMGVQVAPDDTVWFAEQSANYIGHYFPSTGRFMLYPLPWLPDPLHHGQIRPLSSAPNELALDGQGGVWFTEFNADRLGRLDPRSGHIRHYPLSAKASVQTLYPYGAMPFKYEECPESSAF